MARSVSVPNDATLVAYQSFDPEDSFEFEFSDALDGVRQALIDTFPSVSRSSRWVGREDHTIAANRLADFGVSEYNGLVAIWVIPNSDNPLAVAWVSRIESKFREAVSCCFGQDLYRQGSFSNGEAIFQPVNHQQQGEMGLGFSSKEGWL